MKTFRNFGLAVGAIVLWTGLASLAHAQMGMGGYALGYGFLGNGPYNNLYDAGPIPYYSLYPPVYYSQPVPRTYGYSPFAYPPGFMTPEIEWAQPKVMINPHVPQKSSTKPAQRSAPLDRTAAGPKMIVNPYVVPTVASASEAARGAPADEPSIGELVGGELVDNATGDQ